jgi:hypothetical protein
MRLATARSNTSALGDAFDRIMGFVRAADDLISRARDELVAAIPDVTAAVDRILEERIR